MDRNKELVGYDQSYTIANHEISYIHSTIFFISQNLALKRLTLKLIISISFSFFLAPSPTTKSFANNERSCIEI